MKPINNIILASQKETILSPYIGVRIAPYQHPNPITNYQFQWFEWTKIFETGSIGFAPHAMAIAGDGSMIRARISGSSPYYVMVQRVASPSPSSDWSSGWIQRDQTFSATSIAVSAYGANVAVYFISSLGNVARFESTNYGATWGGGAEIIQGCQGRVWLSAAHKNATDRIVCYIDTSDYTLKVLRYESGWTSYTSSITNCYACACCYKGDYNIIVMMSSGSSAKLARVIFGDGYKQTKNTFSSLEYLDTPSAYINAWEIVNNYLENLPEGVDYQSAKSELLRTLQRKEQVSTSPSTPTQKDKFYLPQPGPRANIYEPFQIQQRRRTS